MAEGRASVEVLAHLPDGSTVELTEAVKAMYDALYQSLDWGSGLLSVEDAEQLVLVARTCGFVSIEEAERQIGAYYDGVDGGWAYGCHRSDIGEDHDREPEPPRVVGENLVKRVEGRHWRCEQCGWEKTFPLSEAEEAAYKERWQAASARAMAANSLEKAVEGRVLMVTPDTA